MILFILLNTLTLFQSALRGGHTNFVDFFFIGASVTKRFVRSRIFRYGVPKDILIKGQKTKLDGKKV